MKTITDDKTQPEPESPLDDSELAYLFRIMLAAMPEHTTSTIQKPVNPREALHKAVDSLNDTDCRRLYRVAKMLMCNPQNPHFCEMIIEAQEPMAELP